MNSSLRNAPPLDPGPAALRGELPAAAPLPVPAAKTGRLSEIDAVLDQHRRMLCFYLSLVVGFVALVEPLAGHAGTATWWLLPSGLVTAGCMTNAALTRRGHTALASHVLVLLLGAFVAIQLLHHTGISWAFVLPPLVLFLHPLRRGLLYLLLVAALITAAFVFGHVRLMLRDHEPFEFWGSILAVTAVSALLVRDLGHTVAAVTTAAFRDPLTDLYQRDLFEDLAQRQVATAVREKTSCALLELDVDNLKLVNDRAGHVEGDRILRAVAGVLADELRGADLSARFGGDEFVVLLPGLDLARALDVAQRLHERIVRHPDLVRLQPVAEVTASIGIAVHPQHGTRLGELFAAADAALLAAKSAGKNRLMAAPMVVPQAPS